jgi:predicted phage terminase large subunit-like protein
VNQRTDYALMDFARANPDETLMALDKADGEASLRGFTEVAWHVLEPKRPFVPGYHIDAVLDHLEAVHRGDIIRLLINIPPGCMKSLSVDVLFPAWEWGPRNRPDLRYVSASYSQDLTTRDNRKTRNLITSQWYQALWGDRFNLTSDQNAKTRFDNDKSGFKVATSVGGVGTGERGDRFIVDDPHNVKDGESDAKRGESNKWFLESVTTRVNDPERSAIIVMMQRIHSNDVSGTILEKDLGYTHLCLPMEFEPARRCFIEVTGFRDWREEENQLLWPTRMTRPVVERDKKAMGSYAVAGQFQQRPAPRGGGMFKRAWFEDHIIDQFPRTGIVTRGWDFASTKKEDAPYTATARIRLTADGLIIIEHVKRFRGTPGEVEEMVASLHRLDSPDVFWSLPEDPGAAGKTVAHYIGKKLHGRRFQFTPETGSKEKRAEPIASQAENGNVHMVKADWNLELLDELENFPVGNFKDQVDALSRAYGAAVTGFGSTLSAEDALALVGGTS